MSLRPLQKLAKVRRILDLYAGQGGAGEGYRRAGWLAYGVDRDDHAKRYPGAFHRGDVIDVLERLLAGERIAFTHRDGTVEHLGLADFDAIHASPPCQPYSIATAGNLAARAKYDRLIAATRDLLVQTGLPYVIENVEGRRARARWWVKSPDGLMRATVEKLPAQWKRKGIPAGWTVEKITPTPAEDRFAARIERGGGYVPRSIPVQQRLLGIDWMTVRGMQESIPPAYAEHVGRQLLAHVESEAAA